MAYLLFARISFVKCKVWSKFQTVLDEFIQLTCDSFDRCNNFDGHGTLFASRPLKMLFSPQPYNHLHMNESMIHIENNWKYKRNGKYDMHAVKINRQFLGQFWISISFHWLRKCFEVFLFIGGGKNMINAFYLIEFASNRKYGKQLLISWKIRILGIKL